MKLVGEETCSDGSLAPLLNPLSSGSGFSLPSLSAASPSPGLDSFPPDAGLSLQSMLDYGGVQIGRDLLMMVDQLKNEAEGGVETGLRRWGGDMRRGECSRYVHRKKNAAAVQPRGH